MDKLTKLKDHRTAKGLTQDELANISHISIRTIQRIEKGLSNGSPHTLKKLAKTLEISDWKLLLDENELVTNSSIEHTKNSVGAKAMNLSSLAVIVIPLGNFILPLILLAKSRNRANDNMRKILSFQLIWLLVTILSLVLFAFLLHFFFDSTKTTIIPLSVFVYFLLVATNIFFIINTARQLNQEEEILTFVPRVF